MTRTQPNNGINPFSIPREKTDYIIQANDDFIARCALTDPEHGALWEKVINEWNVSYLTPIAAFKGILYTDEDLRLNIEHLCINNGYFPFFATSKYQPYVFTALWDKRLDKAWRRVSSDGNYISLNGYPTRPQIIEPPPQREKQHDESTESLHRNGNLNKLTYFIAIEGVDAIKIGQSVDPKERCQQLQAGSPLVLSVIATSKTLSESATQERFDHLKIHREWYRAEPELLDFIKENTNE